MERKENDLMMNMIANPDFSLSDFAVVGLNIDNTSIQPIDTYRNIPQIQEYYTDDSGLFQEKKFKEDYQSALIAYNQMASDNYADIVNNQPIYHSANIFAPIEQRLMEPDFYTFEAPNPDKITSSITKLGELGKRTKSIDELAQSKKVLLNPVAVENGATPEWGEAPEDDFTGYFFDTLVLAQYEDDVLNDKGEVIHEKGSFKLNEDGDYYYEKLDGRNVYDKHVLNKMNVFTKEGSWLNQYDFFDSDDIEQKSIIGSTMKNLTLVGSMFIPYVGPWVAAASLASQLVGVFGTFGKMVAGSDNKMLSELEGWSKSVSRQGATSEYAQDHLWCWENFINLAGDVFGQLREQRFIFERVPAVFKGRYLGTEKAQTKYFDELVEYHSKINKAKVSDLYKINKVEAAQAGKILNSKKYISGLAQKDLDGFMKGYNRIGEILGKGYMTGIVVKDTYGEAINAGATDTEATMLTLGYAAAEYALLSSPLGKWIMPELQVSKMRNKAIRDAMLKASGLTNNLTKKSKNIDKASKSDKKQYIRNLFRLGKETAESVQAEYASTGKMMLRASTSSAILEGLEEVSEELLADFSKGCYNTVKWLQGEDTRMDSFGYSWTDGMRSWDSSSVFDRYTMSLFGGALGGGFANINNNYRMGKSFSEMTPEKAFQELVWIGRNEGFGLFRKELNKVTYGNPNLSFQTVEYNGVETFAPGTETDNLDLSVKTAFNRLLDIIENFLNANGANITDNQFLSSQTDLLKDLRFDALHESVVAGRYLNEFNKQIANVFALQEKVNNLEKISLDINKNGIVEDKETRVEISETDKQNLIKAKLELSEALKKLKDLVEGKNADEFVAAALWDMSPVLKLATKWTFPEFVRRNYNKPYSQLTPDEQQKALKDYKTFKLETADELFERSFVYRDTAKKASSAIKESELLFNDGVEQYSKLNEILLNLYFGLEVSELRGDEISEQIEEAQSIVNASTLILNSLNPDEVKNINESYESIRKDLEDEYQSRIRNIDQSLTEEEKSDLIKLLETEKQENLDKVNNDYAKTTILRLYNTLTSVINEFRSKLFINPEIKRVLLKTSKYVTDWINELSDKNKINWDEADTFDDIFTALSIGSLLLDSLNYTPVLQSLDSFLISIGENPVNLTELLQKLDSRLNDVKKDVSLLNFNDQTMLELENALELLDMYKIAILGARTDTADINNLFGYNVTLNEISKKLGKDSDLAEIDSKYADILVQEIETLSDKLRFIKKLYNINQGYTLGKLDRVSVRKDCLIYNQVRKLIDIGPDDPLREWTGFQQLLTAIENSDKLKDISKDLKEVSINYELKKQIEKERITIEDAIYDFFQNNLDKLDNPSELNKIISKFNIYTNSNEILNENLEELDGPSIIWYIAGRAAVKSSNFYGELKEIIKEDLQLAMIATLEMSIYSNYAFIVNGNIFLKFLTAYKIFAKTDWDLKTPDLRKEILKDLGKEEDAINLFSLDNYKDLIYSIINIPLFENLILTEGIAGAGKSKMVLYFTKKLLEKRPEVLKNVALIHGADNDKPDNANSLKESIGIEATTYTPKGFLKHISPDYKPYSSKNGVYDIPKSEYEITSDYTFITKLGISIDNPPSLIIIDEITKFNHFELDLINKYAKHHGISVIIIGDYDQVGVSGNIDVKINNDKLQYTIASHRNTFVHSPKLGVSMRTDNVVKTNNQIKLLELIYVDKIDELKFDFYEDETGLYGDKVLARQSIDVILNEINKLINTLSPNQKIGFIYKDANSELYKRLTSDPEKEGDVDYKRYIDLKGEGTALGNEALYYIIEHNGDLSNTDSKKELYTGITRATQGSITVINAYRTPLSSNKLTSKVDSYLGIESIKKYNKLRKQILDELLSDTKPVSFIPRDKLQTVTNNKPAQTGGLQPVIDIQPTDDSSESDDSSNNNFVEEENSSDDSLENSDSTDTTSDDLTETPSDSSTLVPLELSGVELHNDGTPINDITDSTEYESQILTSNIEDSDFSENVEVQNDGSVDLDILLHSFNTLELGLVYIGVDENGNPIYDMVKDENGKVWNEQRIDSANGLIRIDRLFGLNKLRHPEAYLRIIARLQGLIFNNPSKTELTNAINTYINNIGALIKGKPRLSEKELLKITNVKFAMKLSPVISEETKNLDDKFYVNTKSTPLGKDKREKVYYHNSLGERSDEVIPHLLVAVIETENFGDILEIPLLTLSSPFTLIYSRKYSESGGEYAFPELVEFVNQYINAGYNLLKYVILEELLKKFDNENYSKYTLLFNIIKVYLNGKDRLTWVPDENWTPALNLLNLGPRFSISGDNYIKGLNYDTDSGFVSNYKELYITLDNFVEDPRVVKVSRIFTITNPEYSYNEDTLNIGKAGHACVLVSYDPNINNESKMVDLYLKQLSDSNEPVKVKLVYVIPPTASLKEYITHVNNILYKKEDNLHLGNLFTPYRILNILYLSNEFRQLLNLELPGISPYLEDALNLLNNPNTVIQNELLKGVVWGNKTYINNEGNTVNTPKIKLVTLLGHVLTSLCYKKQNLVNIVNGKTELELDENVINMLSNILELSNFKIYHKALLEAGVSEEIGPFTTVYLENENYYGEEIWRIDGKDCMIHGKLDNYTFRGNVSEIIDAVLENENKHWEKRDKYNFKSKKQTEEKPKIEEQVDLKLENAKSRVSKITKLNLDNISNLEDLSNIINSRTNRISIIHNGELLISEEDSRISTNKSIRINSIEADNRIVGMLELISENGETLTYDIEYYNGELEIKFSSTEILPPDIIVNANNYLVFHDICINDIIPQIKEYDPELAEVLKKETYEEFLTAMEELEGTWWFGENERINSLQEIFEQTAKTDSKIIIQDLIEFENLKNPDRNTNSCIIPVKIKMS